MTDRTATALEVVAIGVRQVALALGFLVAVLTVPIPALGAANKSVQWIWSSKAPRPPSTIPEAEALRIARRNGARVNGVGWINDETRAAGSYHAYRDIARSLGGARWIYHVEIDGATGEVMRREIFDASSCFLD